jgi:hypothetical protein
MDQATDADRSPTRFRTPADRDLDLPLSQAAIEEPVHASTAPPAGR